MNDATVKDICQAWAQAGYGDECFWEHWAECPTEETLTPTMVLACIETQAAEIERLRGALHEVDAAINAEDQPNSERLLRAYLCIRAALTGAKP